jgi:hypothetical protein
MVEWFFRALWEKHMCWLKGPPAEVRNEWQTWLNAASSVPLGSHSLVGPTCCLQHRNLLRTARDTYEYTVHLGDTWAPYRLLLESATIRLQLKSDMGLQWSPWPGYWLGMGPAQEPDRRQHSVECQCTNVLPRRELSWWPFEVLLAQGLREVS